MSWKNKEIVAAIDFGTAYTGYAISMFKDTSPFDDNKPRLIVPHWNSGHLR